MADAVAQPAKSAAARSCSTSLDVPSSIELPRQRPRPRFVDDDEPNVTSVEQDWGWRGGEKRRAHVFSPKYQRADAWYGLIRASQHPPRCERFLLLEDDMIGSGIGFDAKLMATLLLMAVGEQRVLLHVPYRAEQPYRHFNTSGRYCDRPPYTYDCLWQPLSHCDPPPPTSTPFPSPKVRMPYGHWYRTDPVVHVKMSWIFKSKNLWGGSKSLAMRAAIRYIVRPRGWVRRIAECIMRRGGLRPRQFATVFLRHSAEKKAEMNGVLPNALDYADILKALYGGSVPYLAHATAVFASATSASILADFRREVAQSSVAAKNVTAGAGPPSTSAGGARVEVVATENARSERDTHGGRFELLAMSSGVVAAVNLHVTSHSGAYVGLGDSMWTYLATNTMGPSLNETSVPGSGAVRRHAHPADARSLVAPSTAAYKNAWMLRLKCASSHQRQVAVEFTLTLPGYDTANASWGGKAEQRNAAGKAAQKIYAATLSTPHMREYDARHRRGCYVV